MAMAVTQQLSTVKNTWLWVRNPACTCGEGRQVYGTLTASCSISWRCPVRRSKCSRASRRCERQLEPEELEQAIAKLDEQFLDEARADNLRCGTTAVSCLVHGREISAGLDLTVANVGDSRIVLCRCVCLLARSERACSGGKAVRLSEDHKPNRKAAAGWPPGRQLGAGREGAN